MICGYKIFHAFPYTHVYTLKCNQALETVENILQETSSCISEKFCKLDASEEHYRNIRADHLCPLNYNIFHRCLVIFLLLLQWNVDE